MVLEQEGWNKGGQDPWFDVSFSDALGDQLPAITQAYCFGIKLGLLAPYNVNLVSHASPKLSSSPNDCHL